MWPNETRKLVVDFEGDFPKPLVPLEDTHLSSRKSVIFSEKKKELNLRTNFVQ